MNTISQKLLRFAETVFIVWVFLSFAKLFGYNSGIRLSYLFWFALAPFLIYVSIEIIKNFSLVVSLIKRSIAWVKTNYRLKFEAVAQGPFFVKLSGFLGKGIVIVIHLVTLLTIFWDVITKYQTLFIAKVFSKRRYLLILLISGILLDIFWLKSPSDLMFFIILCLLILVLRFAKIGGNFSLIGSLVFLFLNIFLSLIKEDYYANKASSWIFIFLFVAISQKIFVFFRFRRKEKNANNTN